MSLENLWEIREQWITLLWLGTPRYYVHIYESLRARGHCLHVFFLASMMSINHSIETRKFIFTISLNSHHSMSLSTFISELLSHTPLDYCYKKLLFRIFVSRLLETWLLLNLSEYILDTKYLIGLAVLKKHTGIKV